MALDLSFNLPQFDDHYDPHKMRRLVEELERLHASITATDDLTGLQADENETITGSWTFSGTPVVIGDGNNNNGSVMLTLNSERSWSFIANSSGSNTRLSLWSSSNKVFEIGGVTNGRVARFSSGDLSTTLDGALTVAGRTVLAATGGANARGLEYTGTTPWMAFRDTSTAADEQLWLWGTDGGSFRLHTRTDADSAGVVVIDVTRGTGTAVDSIALNAPLIQFDGPAALRFGATPDIRLRAGVNVPTAMSVRANANPANDQAIFAVESSGSATRFFVTQGEGAWARDGFAVGTDDDGDVTAITTATSWLNASGSLYLGEQSSAPADTAAKGQFWVINTTPNRPYFTDDSGIDLPFFGLTQNIQNGNYTLTLSDIGRYISKTSGASGETITIPANASTAFPVGTIIPVENRGGGTLSIAITTDTLLWPAGPGTGTRTLADDASCCLFKAGLNVWYIFGAGVS